MKAKFFAALMLAYSASTNAQNLGNAKRTFEVNKTVVNNGVNGEIFCYRDALGMIPNKIDFPNIGTIFSGGLWVGGYNSDNVLKMSAQTYNQVGFDYVPGHTESAANSFYNRIWEVSSAEVASLKADFEADGQINGNIPTDILEWPAKGNPNIGTEAANATAPFIDKNNDGIYNPTNGDLPKIKGTKSQYFVFNDKHSPHTETNSLPVNIDVEVMPYGFEVSEALNPTLHNSYFVDITLKYKGTEALNNFRIGYMLDNDLGDYADDYVGCDPTRQLAFAYNGDNNDENGFGNNTPLMLVKVSDDFYNNNSNLQMGSFLSYYNANGVPNGNPQSGLAFYNYLGSKWADGSHLQWGGNGYNQGTFDTDFMFPSDPSASNSGAWSECNAGNGPSDRRMLIGFNTNSIQPNETLKTTLIFTHVFNTGTCPNIDQSGLYDAMDNLELLATRDNTATGLESAERSKINILPNPAQDYISINGKSNISQVQIFDTKGSLQYTSFHNFENIDIKKLSSGLYNLVIQDKSGKTNHVKFIKE